MSTSSASVRRFIPAQTVVLLVLLARVELPRQESPAGLGRSRWPRLTGLPGGAVFEPKAVGSYIAALCRRGLVTTVGGMARLTPEGHRLACSLRAYLEDLAAMAAEADDGGELLREIIRRLSAERDALQAEKAGLEEVLRLARGVRGRLHTTLHRAVQQTENLAAERDALLQENARYAKAITSAQRTAAFLETEAAGMRKDLLAVNVGLNALHRLIAAMQADRLTLLDDRLIFKAAGDARSAALQDLEEENAALREALEAAEGKAGAFQQAFRQLLDDSAPGEPEARAARSSEQAGEASDAA